MSRYDKQYYSDPMPNRRKRFSSGIDRQPIRSERSIEQPKLARKITLYEYLANNVPSDCHFVINKFDHYRKARDSKELEYQLKSFVNQFGENGLNELANIHPDKQLLEISNKKYSSVTGDVEPDSTIKKNLNIDLYKPSIPNEEKVLIKENLNISKMLIFGGMILVGLSIIIKNK